MKSSIDSEMLFQLSSKPKIPWAPLVRSRAFRATSRIASAAAIVTIRPLSSTSASETLTASSVTKQSRAAGTQYGAS